MKGALKGKSKERLQNSPNEKQNFSTIFLLVQLIVVLAAIGGYVWYGRQGHSGLEWWKTSVIYQIYPRSFKDSDGDGVGDLRGIISKLDYFQYLNVKAIWLSPFYRSPMKDFGYDISNHTDVDPIFGTLKDFDDLVTESHRRDIKVIIDFVPNHMSDQHPWFQESLKGTGKYRDYFMWSDGKSSFGRKKPPNNWLGVFSGECWRWNEQRKQYYYHAFVKEQPDLNYRNPDVVKDMNDVLRFWMERGVDGIRVDAIMKLFESENIFQDEPRSNRPGVPAFQYEYLTHIHTENLPEIGDVVRGWRKVMDEYEAKDGQSRFMVVELYDPRPLGTSTTTMAPCPSTLTLQRVSRPIAEETASGRLSATNTTICLQAHGPSLWMYNLGNHDRKRVSKRFGAEYVNVLNMLLLTLKGTPTTYYGEELGMEEIEVSFEDTQDPWGINFGKERYTEFSRDPCRSPLQWDAFSQSGFTTSSKPWLPVHPGYKTCNVQVQKNKKDSSLNIYKSLATLREATAFQDPDVQFAVVNDEILSYVRGTANTGRYLVTMNLGHDSSTADYTKDPVSAKNGRVVVNTGNFNESKFNVGKSLSLSSLTLKPGQGLVLKL
ncbi:alpha-glucosidase-like [Haliotis rubra]|uniref:alpha-glucosidase-like n=1 Tax=Haliotis rubra TaxID=36100 RepID=UPI001EE5B660|nr:alpha-glucosidase-like [Haliotis rubra]